MANSFPRWLPFSASKSSKVRSTKVQRKPRRSLLFESLEHRTLLAVAPIDLDWKTVDFTATGNLTGSLKGGYIPAPYVATVTGPITVTNGKIVYDGQTGVGTADDAGTLTATVAGRPAGKIEINKQGQDVTESNGLFTMQLGDATGTPLTGTFSTKNFSIVATTTLQKTNGSEQTATGPGTWKGLLTPVSNEAFDVIVNGVTPNWTSLSVEIDLKVTGPVQKAATRSTPVATVTLAWVDATGKQVGKISDKIGLLWNQAGGKYAVTELPVPPAKATQLMLKTTAGRAVLDQTMVALPPKPTLTINDVKIDEPQPGGTANAIFTVTLDRSNTAIPGGTGFVQFAPVTVKCKTVNGTARGGSDYTPQTSILTFAVDNTHPTSTLTIVVPIKRDKTEIAGLVEQFTIQLSLSKYATIADATGLGEIASTPVLPV